MRSALRLKCFWAKWRGVEKCSGRDSQFHWVVDVVAPGGLERSVVVALLLSLTRDVANAEFRLGHFDCCSLEHGRFVEVNSMEVESSWS